MHVEWWTVDDGVAGSAYPQCVSAAAVAEAGDVTDEDLVSAGGWPFFAISPWDTPVVRWTIRPPTQTPLAIPPRRLRPRPPALC